MTCSQHLPVRLHCGNALAPRYSDIPSFVPTASRNGTVAATRIPGIRLTRRSQNSDILPGEFQEVPSGMTR